jgi:hypothetical protein
VIRLAALMFGILLLHAGDGRDVAVNAALITSMRAAPDDNTAPSSKAFTDKVRCMINTSDGKFVTVIETCEQVRGMIGEPR